MSNATLSLAHVGEAHSLVKYTWDYEGEPQVGTMLISIGEDNVATMGWTDSWHQGASVMLLTGTQTETGISVTGNYPAGENEPDWSWRVTLDDLSTELKMMMFNISPDGEEEWAVETVIQKT